MDARYSDPTIDWLFGRRWTYLAWARIVRAHAAEQAAAQFIPDEAYVAIAAQTDRLVVADGPTDYQIQQIAQLESDTRHDVAAFLYWWENAISDNENRWGRYVAYGLTSSDLVDTALAMRFRQSNDLLWKAAESLFGALQSGAFGHRDTHMVAHTHGQPAEPTSLGLVYGGWDEVLGRTFRDLDDQWMACTTGKLSGPVGTYAHTPPLVVEQALRQLGLHTSSVAMQIVPRDFLSRWASSAALMVDWIAKIGLDLRLAAARGDVQEAYPAQRVGSSSMPHKVNPVQVEQLAGMARLAAGYASMLQTTQTWEQRDISHSSVERVAIPDLMHVVLHSMRSLADVLSHLEWNIERIQESASGASRSPYSAWAALRAVDAGQTRGQARETARRWVSGLAWDSDPHLPHTPSPDWFIRQHPSVPD